MRFRWISVVFCVAALVYGAAADRVLDPVCVAVQRAHTTVWTNYSTITMDQLADFQSLEVSFGKYGGRIDRREEATGFFHAKKLDGRWILVDPEGYHFFGVGVNCVRPSDNLPDCRYAFAAKFGSQQKWVEETDDLLRKLGFNTLGNWSDGALFKKAGRPMPYTVGMSIIGNYAKAKNLYVPSYGSTNLKGDVLPVFDDDLPAYIDKACSKLAETKDDPWVFGIFSDNEIPLFEENIIRNYLALGEDDPGAKRARAWLAERGKTEETITEDDDREFCLLVLSKYFGMVREAIRKYDPNHMYLGTRFHKTVLTQSSAYEAAGRYMDVVAINLYHRWNVDQEMISRMADVAGKPLMITEWYAKGVDSGLRNESGAGFTVQTQKERGLFYENFTISLLRNPNIVGWHWFRYMDEGPFEMGEKASNKGLLNCHFEPYAGLSGSMERINRNVYGLRDYLLNLQSPNLPDQPTVY